MLIQVQKLEFDIDNKLTKSLLPEVKKVYHIDVTHSKIIKSVVMIKNIKVDFMLIEILLILTVIEDML